MERDPNPADQRRQGVKELFCASALLICRCLHLPRNSPCDVVAGSNRHTISDRSERANLLFVSSHASWRSCRLM
jgi:hypothetical protein